MPERISSSEARELVKDLRKQICGSDPAQTLRWAEQIAERAANLHRLGTLTAHKWSMNNLMWLAAQERHLGETHHGIYGGPAQWTDADREVLPTATPKMIWRPSRFRPKATTEDSESEDTDTGTDPAPVKPRGDGTITTFATVKVYDWSDTKSVDGSADPDWDVPLAAGDAGTLDQLVAASPLPVIFGEFPGDGHGSLDRDQIRLDTRQPIGNQIGDLARCLAHVELGHEDPKADDAAAEAALSQYLTLVMLGLGDNATDEVRDQATAHLRGWEEKTGYKLRGKALNERLSVALSAANSIVDRFCVAGIVADAAESEQKAS